MSKTSRDNKKKNSGQSKSSIDMNSGSTEPQNQNHNTKKESLGPNTKR